MITKPSDDIERQIITEKERVRFTVLINLKTFQQINADQIKNVLQFAPRRETFWALSY